MAESTRTAGAKIMTGCEVLHIDPNGEVTYTENGVQHVVTADRVLVNMPPEAHQEGSQLKLNMVLSRLPRLKDPHVDPRTAFTAPSASTRAPSQLAAARAPAAAAE